MTAKKVRFPSGHQLAVTHDLDEHELVKALATLARAERIDAVLGETLLKSEAESPEPERFLQAIVEQLSTVYRETVAVLMVNLDRWFKAETGKDLFKALNRPPLILTQAQVDELIDLIRAHFRTVLRFGRGRTLDAPPELERRWKQMGLIAPNVHISRYVEDAFVAGRLFDVMSENTTYEQMRFAARQAPVTRAAELSLQAVARDVGTAMLAPMNRLADQAEQDINRANSVVLRDIVSRYSAGTLRPTPPNQSGLTPQEVAATESAGAVASWRQLAAELRNRFLSTDAGRDWQRVAATEVRYAYNMGRISEMASRGVPFIEWIVQPNACPWCRQLLLNPDGTPREFSLSFIQSVLSQTGGTNVGRRASRIGHPDGWLPTAIIHPWCRCTPVMGGVLGNS